MNSTPLHWINTWILFLFEGFDVMVNTEEHIDWINHFWQIFIDFEN